MIASNGILGHNEVSNRQVVITLDPGFSSGVPPELKGQTHETDQVWSSGARASRLNVVKINIYTKENEVYFFSEKMDTKMHYFNPEFNCLGCKSV